MNKIIYTLVAFAGILILANCSPKIVKSTTTENKKSSSSTNAEVVETLFSKLSNEEQMDIVKSIHSTDEIFNKGQTIYQTNCGKCHELYKPDSRNIATWMKVMKRMSKKASLTDEHYKLVCIFLNVKAKI
jgi:nitrate/TMAO reductase-like tetraheme cytochrome c subunit